MSKGVSAVIGEFHFEWDGVGYTLTRPSFRSEANFSGFLKTKMLRELKELAGGEEFAQIYRDMLQEVQRSWAGFEYDYGGVIYAKAMNSDNGLKEMIYFCLLQKHEKKDIPRQKFDEIWADIAKRSEIIRGYLSFFGLAASKPKRPDQDENSSSTSPKSVTESIETLENPTEK